MNGSRLSKALIALLLVLGALAYRDLLFWDPSSPGLPGTARFFFRVSETAPQILFLLAVPLFYRRRERIARALGGEPAPLLALPLLALGVALFLWGHHAGALDLVLASLLVVTLGSAVLLSGRGLARELMLPLLFLAFAIPLPGVITNQLIYPLQVSTAVHSGWLLHAIGITAVREGNLLDLAGDSFQIIENCSGLRSIVVLTTLAVGWLCFFPTRLLPAVLLVLSAPVIAYFVNTLRILTLVLSPNSDLAAAHSIQGLGIFLVGLVIFYWVDRLLQRIPGGSGDRVGEAENAPPLQAASDWHGRAIALALLLAAMLGVSAWDLRWDPPNPPRRPSLDLPGRIGGWLLARELEPDRIFLGSVGFRNRWYGEYQHGGETVSLFVGFNDRLNRRRSLLSPKNAVPGAGWQVEERKPIQLAPSGPLAAWVTARSGAVRTLSFHWYAGSEPLAREILRACLATDQSTLRRPGGAWVFRLTTEVDQTREGQERAEARLRGFAKLLRSLAAGSPTEKTAAGPDGPGRSVSQPSSPPESPRRRARQRR
jgi:exosortase